MKASRVELSQVLAELSVLFPDWRFGQTVANVSSATPNGTQAEAIWDIDHDEMLAVARRLLECNRDRVQVSG